MMYEVNSVSENIYKITSPSEIYYLIINSTMPFVDSTGNVVANIIFLKSSDEKWKVEFTAPFSFILNQFTNSGIIPHEYLIAEMIQEVKNQVGIDLSGPFTEISRIHGKSS